MSSVNLPNASFKCVIVLGIERTVRSVKSLVQQLMMTKSRRPLANGKCSSGKVSASAMRRKPVTEGPMGRNSA
jgi:hypothetical protein